MLTVGPFYLLRDAYDVRNIAIVNFEEISTAIEDSKIDEIDISNLNDTYLKTLINELVKINLDKKINEKDLKI